MSTFGEWLRNQRNERRLTREEFAQRVGCSVAMLRKIEADERRPSAQVAALIAGALELPPDQHATFIRVARGELGVARLPQELVPTSRPGISTTSAVPQNNLPVSPTPLIGRKRELAELHEFVTDSQCRMLTLVGPGGIGKTRLAIEAASRLQDHFADGVYFVSLAPVDSSHFIVPLIAHALGFSFLSANSADPKTQLLNYLKEKRMLLLVDNIEHLLKQPGVELFAELLACASEVKILCTSREPLNLQPEWVFEVRGLPLPEDSTDTQSAQDTSIELFLQRSRRAYVGFNATTGDYPAIVRICQLLDGTPLAIELAAAWVRALTCEEIADEIERSLDFLSTSARDLPARHRSMRAVFDHSWELLSEDERRALARLTVFRGGFDRNAAAEVAGASLGMLSALVAKSLVRRSEAGRYDLHELIRQYAASYLEAEAGAGEAARQQHYDFYLALAQAAAPQLKSAGQLEWLRRLEQEHDNFRAALAWSTADDGSDAALGLAAELRWFWGMRGYFDEGRMWLTKALQRGQDSPPAELAVARALEGLALLENAAGHEVDARTRAEQSASTFRQLNDKQGLADALTVLGQALRWQGEANLSHARLKEALALYRELGDQWNVARCLFRLGAHLADWGGDSTGRLMLDEGSAILDELGEKFLSGNLLATRGIVAFTMGDYGSARSRFERSLAIAREIGDPWGMADAFTNIGGILRVQGDYAAAGSYLEEALQIYEKWGRGVWCADPRSALAENEIAQGHFSAAHLHLDEACPCAESSGNQWLLVLTGYFEGLLAYYEGNLHRAAAVLEQTITLARESQYQPDLARSLIALGRVRRAQGEAAHAAVPLMEGLRLFSQSGAKLGMAAALEAFAGLQVRQAPDYALRCFGAGDALRSAIGAPIPPVDQPAYTADMAALRTQVGVDPFADAWSRAHAEPYQTLVAEILASSGSVH